MLAAPLGAVARVDADATAGGRSVVALDGGDEAVVVWREAHGVYAGLLSAFPIRSRTAVGRSCLLALGSMAAHRVDTGNQEAGAVRISVIDLENTLLQLMADQGLAAGDELPLAKLEGLWAGTTLRRADLGDSLERLSVAGAVIVDGEPSSTLVTLTETGLRRARTLNVEGRLPWVRHLRDVLLPTVRRRSGGSDRSSPRRHYDLTMSPQHAGG